MTNQRDQSTDTGKRIPVWIDTDPAIGLRYRDIDDGLALLLAFASPELEIRGVSSVFGNANGHFTYRAAREITTRFGPKNVPVYRGAYHRRDLGRTTEASEAMISELSSGKSLTIISLGPVTNVATVVMQRPDLASRIDRVIVQSGRSLEAVMRLQILGLVNTGVFDFNFERDVNAFRVLLSHKVPLVIVPREIYTQDRFTVVDYERFKHGPAGARFMAQWMEHRLWFYKKFFGMDGFVWCDPFLVAYAATPQRFGTTRLPITILKRRHDIIGIGQKRYLRLSPGMHVATEATYCQSMASDTKQFIIDRILSSLAGSTDSL